MSITPDDVMEEPPEEAADYELAVSDVMTGEFVSIPPSMTIADAIEFFKDYTADDPSQTTIYYVYIVDDSDHLVGVVSLRELLVADETVPVSSIMTDELVTFHRDADAEQAAIDVAEIHYPAIPVTNDEGVLLGIVRSDTLVGVMEEESSEDMLRMQGMNLPEIESGDFTDVETRRSTIMLDAPISQILRIRVPWLLVALAGGFLAGGVIGVYEDTLEAVVILAFFIPVIMDMGGNVGTQSSTIFIRGVVLGHIDKSNVARRLVKETFVGILIGLLVGVVAAGVAFLWIDRADIAYVVLGAMVGTSAVAALVGFLIPWLVYLAGQDPAAGANPIVTTIKDVTGLLIYFGLATLLVIELGI